MKSEQLEQMRTAALAATPGPWTACHDGGCQCHGVWSTPADAPVLTTNTDSPDEGIESTSERKQNDCRFVVAWNPQAALDVLVAYTELRAVMADAYFVYGRDGATIWGKEARRVLAEYPALLGEEPA